MLSKLLLCRLLISCHQTCACVRRVLNISLSTYFRQAYNPFIMPLKQSPFTVIYSTCYRRVFCRARLVECIPNVSCKAGTYQLDTDLPGTHIPLKERLTGHSGSYTWCSVSILQSTRGTPVITITCIMLIKARDIHTTMLALFLEENRNPALHRMLGSQNIHSLHRVMEIPSLPDFI